MAPSKGAPRSCGSSSAFVAATCPDPEFVGNTNSWRRREDPSLHVQTRIKPRSKRICQSRHLGNVESRRHMPAVDGAGLSRRWQFAAARFSIHPIKTRQEGELLCTLFNRITSIHPVRPQIVGNVEHFQLCETQVMQGFVSRLYVGTTPPGAASTIDNDESASGEPFHSLAQLLHHRFVGGRTIVFRTRKMGLAVRKSKAHINEEWSFAFG